MAQQRTPGPWAVGFDDGTGETYITAGRDPENPSLPLVVVSGATDSWGVEQGIRNPADAKAISQVPELIELAKAVAGNLVLHSTAVGVQARLILARLGEEVALAGDL